MRVIVCELPGRGPGRRVDLPALSGPVAERGDGERLQPSSSVCFEAPARAASPVPST